VLSIRGLLWKSEPRDGSPKLPQRDYTAKKFGKERILMRSSRTPRPERIGCKSHS
jgi:hypothetical protein